MNIENICVIGNDGRMDYVAQVFYDAGYDVYRDLHDATQNSVIVLPPPVGEKAMAELLPELICGQQIYGGAVSNRFIHECGLSGISVDDYLKWSHVTQENAALTAKGIIKEAVAEKAVLEKSNCLVAGYGYCGKAIGDALMKVGAYVDIMVRRKELASELEDKGFGFVLISDATDKNMEKYSYVFNTVPAPIFTDAVLSNFSDTVMIFDIASAPGGTDFSYCKDHGIYAVNSLGIPGKEYPKEAGEIIAHAILQDLSQK